MAQKRRKMVAMKPTKEIRSLTLPKGGTLELEIMPGFYDRVRLHFSLASDVPVADEYLRMFVFGTVKTAIDKAEEEMNGKSG